MYIPKHFSSEDHAEAVLFMKKFNFGTLVTAADHLPVATHLPFVIQENNKKITISSHLARANNQWLEMNNREALIIFSEPHAYISPRFYEKKENVPTWNYMAVHTYGIVNLINEPSDIFKLLESMMQNFDEDYLKQWEGLSEEYKNNMLKGIVAFTFNVTQIQYKKKLSQNRSEVERKNIYTSLSSSKNTNEKQVGAFMQKNARLKK